MINTVLNFLLNFTRTRSIFGVLVYGISEFMVLQFSYVVTA